MHSGQDIFLSSMLNRKKKDEKVKLLNIRSVFKFQIKCKCEPYLREMPYAKGKKKGNQERDSGVGNILRRKAILTKRAIKGDDETGILSA